MSTAVFPPQTDIDTIKLHNFQSFWQVAAKDMKEVIQWSAAAYIGTSLLLTGANPLVAGVYMGSSHLAGLLVHHITKNTIPNEDLRKIVNFIIGIAISLIAITALGLSGGLAFKIGMTTLITLGAGFLMVKGFKAYMAEHEVAEKAKAQAKAVDQVEQSGNHYVI